MTPNERFEVLKSFWGYGNPTTAKILFIGIEEGGEWSEENLVKNSPERRDRIRKGKSEEVLDELLSYRKNKAQQYASSPNWNWYSGIGGRFYSHGFGVYK